MAASSPRPSKRLLNLVSPTSTQPSSPTLSDRELTPSPLQTPPVGRSLAAHYSEQDEKKLHEVSGRVDGTAAAAADSLSAYDSRTRIIGYSGGTHRHRSRP